LTPVREVDVLEIRVDMKPNRMPIPPPIRPWIKASTIRSRKTCRSKAPRHLRTPISLYLS